MAFTVIILARESTKQEILSRQSSKDVEWVWVDSVRALAMIQGDAYFDLQFNDSRERLTELRQIKGKPVFVSAMETPCSILGEGFIRINAWPGMLTRPTIELAVAGKAGTRALEVMEALGWQAQLAPDTAGFISARILATVINEAYFTLEAGVSSREEIDIAMKLGTNYPAGPFEWAAQIGTDNVVKLLREMSVDDNCYEPCTLLRVDKPAPHI